MRNKFTRVKKDKVEGLRYKSTTLYPTITRKDSDITYYTKFGDSYGSLAHRFYGDQSLWWIIAKANEGFKGNIRFKIGERILVPMEVGEIVSELERLNNRVD